MNEPIETIYRDALQKYQRGAVKYGDYVPVTDNRDMLNETEEEILDAINYLAMFLMKIRAVRGESVKEKAPGVPGVSTNRQGYAPQTFGSRSEVGAGALTDTEKLLWERREPISTGPTNQHHPKSGRRSGQSEVTVTQGKRKHNREDTGED